MVIDRPVERNCIPPVTNRLPDNPTGLTIHCEGGLIRAELLKLHHVNLCQPLKEGQGRGQDVERANVRGYLAGIIAGQIAGPTADHEVRHGIRHGPRDEQPLPPDVDRDIFANGEPLERGLAEFSHEGLGTTRYRAAIAKIPEGIDKPADIAKEGDVGTPDGQPRKAVGKALVDAEVVFRRKAVHHVPNGGRLDRDHTCRKKFLLGGNNLLDLGGLIGREPAAGVDGIEDRTNGVEADVRRNGFDAVGKSCEGRRHAGANRL